MTTAAAGPAFLDAVTTLLGPAYVKTDAESRLAYGTDALKRGTAADVVLLPAGVQDVAWTAAAGVSVFASEFKSSQKLVLIPLFSVKTLATAG